MVHDFPMMTVCQCIKLLFVLYINAYCIHAQFSVDLRDYLMDCTNFIKSCPSPNHPKVGFIYVGIQISNKNHCAVWISLPSVLSLLLIRYKLQLYIYILYAFNFLAHLSQSDMVGFCDRFLSSVHPFFVHLVKINAMGSKLPRPGGHWFPFLYIVKT
jgi:hypothetical protein